MGVVKRAKYVHLLRAVLPAAAGGGLASIFMRLWESFLNKSKTHAKQQRRSR
jgi:hypothetical protein